MFLSDTLYLDFELAVAANTPRHAPWIRRTCLLFVVGRGGDRYLGTDRLDPVFGAMIVDKRHHYFGQRSSSAWAKYADALRKISFTRLSSLLSRASCFKRSRSSVLIPARRP